MKGGTAACVVAGRLAAADANLRLLLLEAGPTTYNDPAHTDPLRLLSHLAPDSCTVRAHVTQPSAVLGGRTTVVPCGQCLGGGGSVNCASLVPSHLSTKLIELYPRMSLRTFLSKSLAVMIYMRPSASDYDDWETVYKNPGWGSKDLVPLLRKVSKYGISCSLGLKLRDYRSRRIRVLMVGRLTAQTVPLGSRQVVFPRTSKSSSFKWRAHLILTVRRSRITRTRMIWKQSTRTRWVLHVRLCCYRVNS